MVKHLRRRRTPLTIVLFLVTALLILTLLPGEHLQAGCCGPHHLPGGSVGGAAALSVPDGQMLTQSGVPPLSVVLDRSDYRSVDPLTQSVVITFTITNQLTPAIQPQPNLTLDPYVAYNVMLVESLDEHVMLDSASHMPDQQGSQYVWNVGNIPPTTSVTRTLTLKLPSALVSSPLDTGAVVWGTFLGDPIQIQAPPIGQSDARTPSLAETHSAAATIYQGEPAFTNGPIRLDLQTSHATFAGYTAAAWQSSAQTQVGYTAMSIDAAEVRLPTGQALGKGHVNAWALMKKPVQLGLSGEGMRYTADGWSSVASYAGAIDGIGMEPIWSDCLVTAHADSPAHARIEPSLFTIDKIYYGGGQFNLDIQGQVMLWGDSACVAPSFARSYASKLRQAAIGVALWSGAAMVGDRQIDPARDFAVAGFTGAISSTEATAGLDRLQADGTAEQLVELAVDPLPSAALSFQRHFQVHIDSNLADRYHLEVIGPPGWIIQVNQTGAVTAIQKFGLDLNDTAVFVVRARSYTRPELIVSTEQVVSGMLLLTLSRWALIIGGALLALFLFFGLQFAVMRLGMRPMRQASRKQIQEREIVHQRIPGISAPAIPRIEEELDWKKFLVYFAKIVMLLALMASLFAGTTHLWPGAPSWIQECVLGLALWLVPPLGSRAIAQLRRSKKPQSPLWRDLLLHGVWVLLSLSLAVARQFPAHLAAFFGKVPPTVWLGLLAATPVMLPLAPFFLVLGALKRGNYDMALGFALTLRRLNPRSPAFLFLHGTVLDLAGQHQEAVRLLRESLEEGQKNPMASQASALENLGYALLHLGHYDEATEAFEAAIAIEPKKSGSYSGLAEVLLFQGIHPDHALDLAEQALQHKCGSLSSRKIDGYVLGEILANCAWAQALLGRYEALQTLERAFWEGDRMFKPVLAGIHYRAARVFHARGDRGAAAEHLGKAVQIDPRGMYGALAAQALEHGF